MTTAICKSTGLEIHLPEARGICLSGDSPTFFEPITKRNSGCQLMNTEGGQVIGVLRLQSQVLIHQDPETLEKFNLSVIE